MTRADFIELLCNDLRNEWKHLKFYLYHASALVGLHAEEYKEVFLKEAASEMAHVTEFSDLIYGLGGKAHADSYGFMLCTNVRDALQCAYDMERDVVKNYAARIKQAQEVLEEPDATWVTIFLEDQLNHSRRDVDRYWRLLAEK
jgi:bacterioferritin (cytochrome b1)